MRGRFGGCLLRVVIMLLYSVLVGLGGSVSSASAADNGVAWDSYDVRIEVRSDGTMHVTERQLVRFDGSFSHGFADIPLNRVEDIENVSVAVANGEDETPEAADFVRPSRYSDESGTFTYATRSGQLSINYGFDRTSASDSTRLVLLEYDVLGGIRVYDSLEPANQQIWWIAISDQVTEVGPIENATVTIDLPETVAADQVIADPDNPTVEGATYTWRRAGLGSGDDFEVRLQVPPITTATVPDWQEQDDQIRESRAQAEERSAFAGTILLAGGLLLLFGGGAGFYALWFVKGRDPNVGAIAEYVTEPPDDLRPGAVGTLLDETANTQDIVATVMDLAARGVITMGGEDGSRSVGNEFTLLRDGGDVQPYEQTVISAIFGPGAQAGAKAELPTIRGIFAREAEEIFDGFYGELVDHQYFRSPPDHTRRRWRRVFRIIPILAIIASVIVIVAVDGSSGWFLFPVVIAAMIFMFAGALSKLMPSKTAAGAEAAARWRAFRNYLDGLDERKELDSKASQAMLEKYLPYAIAMNLSQKWVGKFEPQPASGGAWTAGPVGGGGTWGRTYRRRGGWTTGGPYLGGSGNWGAGTGTGSRGSGDGVDVPSLQDMSDSASGGLQGGSNSLFSMLGTVAKAFASSSSGGGSFGSSRGGGFSGGGGSSSGGGGGGGGGGRGFG